MQIYIRLLTKLGLCLLQFELLHIKMGDCLRLLASIFLLLFFCSNKSYVYGARDLADHHHAQELKSLIPSSTCSPTNQGLQIVHRYGPCSPLGQESPRPSYREILLQDQHRVRALNSISSSIDDDNSSIGTEIPLGNRSMGNGNYVVQVGFGTPSRHFTLMFDTGSSTTWIQCKPCRNCYDQDEAVYDPSESSTFSNATCVNSTDTCEYTQVYHDKSYSRGYYVRDTLTVSDNKFSDFVFGCGHDNSDKFGRVAGVLGVGPGDISLMSQTLVDFGKLFCYCLPSTESSTGYVVFGIKALEICNPENSIPLLSDTIAGLNQYFVQLVGITIGKTRMETPSNSGSSSTSAIVDSGTIISRLPKSVYSQLRSAFQDLMSQYPAANPLDNLTNACYSLEGYDQNNIIPSMTLHFKDSVDLKLDPSAVVFKDPVTQVTCLAFAGNDGDDDLTIIGNHQQRDVKIYYDILGGYLGFSSGGCDN